MTLDEYLSTSGMAEADFADLVGVDRSTISRIRKGKLNTTRDVMVRVISASGNAVSPGSLIYGCDDHQLTQQGAA